MKTMRSKMCDRKNYFYGWYFRCQGRDESAAVIPAVHLSPEKCSCSIQVVTQSGSLYREFPIEQFRMNRKRKMMRIGENVFSPKGIRLQFDAAFIEKAGDGENGTVDEKPAEKSVTVSGILHFGKFLRPKYDIMGPFALITGMECRHAVYSMRHTVNGELRLGCEKIQFQNAAGYMEGDSGTSFPDKYIWTQHFLPQGSVMLAAASIPFAGKRFTGTIGFLLDGKREYRFATYLGAAVTKMDDRKLWICQGRYRLCVYFTETDGSMLKAPVNGQMTRSVRENIACKAEYTLMCGKKVILHEITEKAAAELSVAALNHIRF